MTSTVNMLIGLFLMTLCGVKAAEICCPNIGCFDDSPPFQNAPLPQCIETMKPVYSMFTRANTNIGEAFDHTSVPSVYVGSRRTIFLVHGWNSDGTSSWLRTMKNTLLDKEDANVVIVDWGGGAQLANYFQAASNTRTMGAYSAMLFDNLIANGGSSAMTWCMGHSLGAHLCGHTGMKSARGIHRATGLDPAGPWFQGSLDRTIGINPTSGAFVDIIHTDVELGQLRDLGHIDFYPNGGAEQPGCFLADDDSTPEQQNSCAHSRAHQYMEESVRNDCFLSRSKCTDYNNINSQTCSHCSCGNNACAHLGYNAELGCQTSGWFEVPVSATSPWCQN
jgi:pimeloyl-ACP methyl ester carboxylesterase